MKHLLLTTIAAVLVVGCGVSKETTIWKATEEGDASTVELLISLGQDVNAKDDDGRTPLHYAAAYDHKEIVELLIAAGADLISKDEEGATPLHNAALQGNKEIAQMLIAKGANVNAVDDVGDTPLDFAEDTRAALGFKYILSAKKETADLLRKHGGKTGRELKAAGN